MNEVTKLYENAGFNKREIENCTYKNSTPCGHSCDDGEDCPYLEIKNDYPPFTAEKQLKLIKWLLYNPKVDCLNMFYKNEEDYLEISIDCDNGYSYENSFDDNFEIAIASALNTLWQDLTDGERKQIKEILE